MTLKDKGTAKEGFAALFDGTGNSGATVATTVTTKCVLEDELVRLVHSHGGQPLRGSPLGLMPELWPFDMCKRPLIAHAEEFVKQIDGHGYIPLTGVHEFLVWGPYAEKVGALKPWVPEEGNPLIPKWAQRTAQRVWGYQGDEFDWSKGCAFLIQGRFTRKASLGAIDEETGAIIV